MAWSKNTIIADPKYQRPSTQAEKLEMVEMLYKFNGWDKLEHKANCAMLSLPLKALKHYSEQELDVFLADFEKYNMVYIEDQILETNTHNEETDN